ncbi:hypothetical protein [Alcanivorax sp. DP30]|uniref:hypothetical protein n=1 Tax=Alcanivorax sp. DP30 TaxID=2606217 RepID=UPI001367B21C|nr:hypothetical protein [Alcanivorax sp. DP30]MZR62968.1 hypothetical protein [Alcanivorax sp. DP30]
MLEILQNSWVVNIGTGVISGLLVALLTRAAFSSKDDKELARAIESANREVLFAIRAEVSESNIPALEVVHALINATARKYKLETRLLLKPQQLSEELIKEVMDSSFISSKQKAEYCQALASLKASQETELDRKIQKENEKFVASVEYRERLIMVFSITLGMIAAFSTMFVLLRSTAPSGLFSKLLDSVFPMMMIFGVVVLFMNIVQVLMKARHKRLREEFGVPLPPEEGEK